MNRTILPIGTTMGGLNIWGELNHNEFGDPHSQYVLKCPVKTFSMTAAGRKPVDGGAVTYAKVYTLKINKSDSGVNAVFEMRRLINDAPALIRVSCSLAANGDIATSSNIRTAIYVDNAIQLGSSNIVGYLYDDNGYKVLDIYFKSYFRGINSGEPSLKMSGGRFSIAEIFRHPLKDVSIVTVADCKEISDTAFATEITGKTLVKTLMKSSATKLVKILISTNSSQVISTAYVKNDDTDYKFDTYNLGMPTWDTNKIVFNQRANDTNNIYRRVVDEPETKIISVTPYLGNTTNLLPPHLPVIGNIASTTGAALNIRFWDLVNNQYATALNESVSFMMVLEIVP